MMFDGGSNRCSPSTRPEKDKGERRSACHYEQAVATHVRYSRKVRAWLACKLHLSQHFVCRFDREIYLALPTLEERIALFRTQFDGSVAFTIDDADWMKLAEKTEQYVSQPGVEMTDSMTL